MFENFDIRWDQVSLEVWVILGMMLLVPLMLLLFHRSRKSQGGRLLQTKVLVYGSLCVALSFLLSYIRLFRMPQGGSVTLAGMLPIIIFAVAFGPLPGILAGFALGLLNLIQDPYIVHWMQIFLDYPLAYGALGLAGIYRKHLSLSAFIGGFGRLAMSFLSGVIFFREFTPEGWNDYIYSIVYNGSFIGAEILIIIVLLQVPQVQSLLRQMRRSSYST
jgi:thiamine transporter